MDLLQSLPPFQNLSLQDSNAKTLLGPLYDFAGTWTNDPNQGWNLIAVPGPLKSDDEPVFFNSGHGFILETIPYIETISFTPISMVLNRGQYPLVRAAFSQKDKQEIQQIGAMLYDQTIISAGVDPSNPNYAAITKFFEDRGFAKDTPIHAERGMLLNITNLSGYGNENFQLARMGTIPHGNTMLCLGNSKALSAPDIDPNGNNASPTPVDPSRQMPVEYTINTYASPNHSLSGYPFYPDFIPTTPNQTLINANKGVNFASTNHISLSTLNGTGGLLSIPFVRGGFDGTKINTTQMTVDYWISKIKDSEEIRLQYVQNIDLIFPSNLDASLPIIWPHIGLNTLKLVPK
jgi:hypothetical protein